MNEQDILKWLDMLGGRADPAFKQQSEKDEYDRWIATWRSDWHRMYRDEETYPLLKHDWFEKYLEEVIEGGWLRKEHGRLDAEQTYDVARMIYEHWWRGYYYKEKQDKAINWTLCPSCYRE